MHGLKARERLARREADGSVALITPYDRGAGALRIHPPSAQAPKPGDVELPPILAIQTDIVELLLAERQVER